MIESCNHITGVTLCNICRTDNELEKLRAENEKLTSERNKLDAVIWKLRSRKNPNKALSEKVEQTSDSLEKTLAGHINAIDWIIELEDQNHVMREALQDIFVIHRFTEAAPIAYEALKSISKDLEKI